MKINLIYLWGLLGIALTNASGQDAITKILETGGKVDPTNANLPWPVPPSAANVIRTPKIQDDSRPNQILNNENESPPTQQYPLNEPTNYFVKITHAEGELRVMDSAGIIIESNWVYLPRISFDDVSDQDSNGLINTKTGYDALTTLGNVKARTAISERYEKQLRTVWLNETSLNKKIQTRLTIIKAILEYNAAAVTYKRNAAMIGALEEKLANSRAVYVAASQELNKATQISQDDSLRRKAFSGNNVVVNANPYGGTPDYKTKFIPDHPDAVAERRQNSYNFYEAQRTLPKAANSATTLERQTVNAENAIQQSEKTCERNALVLASFGVVVSGSPPFDFVPPLLIAREVDDQLNANSKR